MKKVLVTGGTGFLGANVVASFKKSKNISGQIISVDGNTERMI